jgi:hypothetical protein
MEKVVYLEKEELEKVQSMNAEFTKMKVALGEMELRKQDIMSAINELKTAFAIHEKSLVEKYSPNSIINIQTGEVTQKK